MTSAAARIDTMMRGADRDGTGRGPLRCVLMDDNSFDRRVLRRVAAASRYDIELIETAGIAETRRALEAGAADLLLLDYRVPDGDGIAFARELSADERHAGIPVVVVTGVGSEDAAVQAIRSGVADYLSKDGLTTRQFDQAVENALGRSTAGSAGAAACIAELTAENTALRRASLRNMRLLKGSVLPLIAFGWRMLRGERVNGTTQEGAAQEGTAQEIVAQELAQSTRSALRLIDDTVILAATHRAGEAIEPVDLADVVAAVLRDEAGEIRESGARVSVGALPVLTVRASQMLLLFEELLLGAVRAARLGHAPQVEIGAGVDPEGNPIIVFREHGLRLAAREDATARRFGRLDAATGTARDGFSWSLCQRIVEKNDGQFRIARQDGDGCTIRMRFPKSMLA